MGWDKQHLLGGFSERRDGLLSISTQCISDDVEAHSVAWRRRLWAVLSRALSWADGQRQNDNARAILFALCARREREVLIETPVQIMQKRLCEHLGSGKIPLGIVNKGFSYFFTSE